MFETRITPCDVRSQFLTPITMLLEERLFGGTVYVDGPPTFSEETLLSHVGVLNAAS
jgi:hypothetical protein